MDCHAAGWIFLNAFIGMKALQIMSTVGSLKTVAVMVFVGSTMLISLFKGKTLHLWNSVLQHPNEEKLEVASHQSQGTILLVGSSFTFACWYLIQGALAMAGKYSLNSWAVAKKGPAYPPMFSPLSLVFTVVLGSIFLGDDITVGS